MLPRLLLVLWTLATGTLAQAITVVQANTDGISLGSSAIEALFQASGNPLDLSDARFQGAANSSGSFLNGPWGMESGSILTTGLVSGASFPSANQSVNNQAAGSVFCGSDSFNAADLTMNVTLSEGYSGITSTLVYASK